MRLVRKMYSHEYRGYKIVIRIITGWVGAEPMQFTRSDGSYRLYREHWYGSAGEAFEFLKEEIDRDIDEANNSG